MRRFRIITIPLAVLVAAGIFVTVAAALNIKDTPIPTGKVGVPYVFRVELEDGSGTAPVIFDISSGSLPPGLQMVSYGERFGEIRGTPTQAGTWNFFIQAKDSQCCPVFTQEPRTMTITDRLIISTQSVPDAAINQPYGPVQLTASGGTVTSWTITSGTPPPGVTLSSTGVLQGTPTASGPFSFTVQAASDLGPDTKQLTIFVVAPLVLGGSTGVAPAKELLGLNWKVNQTVAWAVKASGGKAPYTYSSTTLPVGLTLNPADGTLAGVGTVAGQKVVTFTVTDSVGVTDTLKALINIKALLAFSTTVKPPSGKVGKSFSWKLPVTGASKIKLFVASGAFPPGLELDEATGVLSGTPLKAGSFKVKFWVLGDPGTQISKTYTLKINP